MPSSSWPPPKKHTVIRNADGIVIYDKGSVNLDNEAWDEQYTRWKYHDRMGETEGQDRLERIREIRHEVYVKEKREHYSHDVYSLKKAIDIYEAELTKTTSLVEMAADEYDEIIGAQDAWEKVHGS